MLVNIQFLAKHNSEFSVPPKAHHIQAIVPIHKGFDKPQRPRRPRLPSHYKHRRAYSRPRPQFNLAVTRRRRSRALRLHPLLRRLFRPSPTKYRRAVYWKQPRSQRFGYRCVRYRLFNRAYSTYLQRTKTFLKSLLRPLRCSPANAATMVVGASRGARLRAGVLGLAQPTPTSLRYRSARLRYSIKQFLYAPRRLVQFAGNCVKSGSVLRAVSSENQSKYLDKHRPPNVIHASAGPLRLSRLTSFVATSADALLPVLGAGGLSKKAATALRARLLRRSKRRVVNFFFERKDRGGNRVLQRNTWRKGTRGYAVRFGKSRYRLVRRDKQVVRRTIKRLTLHRALLLKAISTHARAQRNAHLVARQRSNALALLLSSAAGRTSNTGGLVSMTHTTSYGQSHRALRQQSGRLSQSSMGITHSLSRRRFKFSHRSSCLSSTRTSLSASRVYVSKDGKAIVSNGKAASFLLRSLRQNRFLPQKVADPLIGSDAAALYAVGLSTAKSLPVVRKTFARRSWSSLLDVPSSPAKYRARFALWQNKKQLETVQFLLKQPQLRLPRTNVTRSRRRKGGLGLFAQGASLQPRTAAGLRNLLLPPTTALFGAYRTNVAAAGTGALDLMRVRQRRDTAPQYWSRRRLRRVDLVPYFWFAHNAGVRSRRRRMQLARKKYLAQKSTRAGATARRADILLQASTHRSVAVKGLTGVAAAAQRAAYAAGAVSVSRGVRATNARTPVKRSVRRLFATSTSSNASKRLSSMWQARSVRLMAQCERALSAWSPQYQTRWRRWASPRQDGLLLRRSWPSARALRERKRLNAALLRRHQLQRRYWDRSFIHLQYHHGSIASAGYSRIRRSSRLHSSSSRWWKPVTYSVPFAHAYSRRTINAKRYFRRALQLSAGPRAQELSGYTPAGFTRPMLRMERHMVSRKIPWRNFNYPAPRRGAPATIQRWTMRYKGKNRLIRNPARAQARSLIFARTPRELRLVEQTSSSYKVWSHHRWEHLDPSSKGSLESNSFSKLFDIIPPSVWTALKKKAGSISRYTALQRAVLSNYRQWGAKVFTSTLPEALTVSQRKQATMYLLDIVRRILLSTSELETAVQVGAAYNQQTQLRSAIMSQKVATKHNTFWKHRVLPGSPEMYSMHYNPTVRENSHLYKRWLHGAERFLQETQRGYTPTRRSRYSPNRAVDFGRYRLRFPASGRRRHSYDSMLHAFAKRTSPSQFYRASSLRYVRPSHRVTGDYRETLLSTIAPASLQRQRLLRKKLSGVGAVSSVWREVLAYRGSLQRLTLSSPLPEKRRFMPLPVLTSYKHRDLAMPSQSYFKASPLRAVRIGVLRCALRRRRGERVIVDLRKAVLQRRLPRERALRPWKLRRRTRARMCARSKPWGSYTGTTSPSWGLSHLSAKGVRFSNLAAVSKRISPTGEVLSLPQGTLRRDLRALRGFTVLLNRQKRRLRRKVRDSQKGTRGHRRRYQPLSPKGAVLLKTHWSEGKELRGFRRLGKRPFRSAVKHVLTESPKLFAAAYGAGRRALLVMGSRRRAASAHSKFVAAAATTSAIRQVALRRGTKFLFSAAYFSALSSSQRSRQFKKLLRRSRKGKFNALSLRKEESLIRCKASRSYARSVGAAESYNVLGYVGQQLVKATSQAVAVGPLQFQLPTKKIIKSAGAKAKEVQADIASKEERYKLTSQYVESLTQFIPELMNYMFSRRITHHTPNVVLHTARHLIRNIYWSLRIYLNVDPFDARFFLRDRNPAARVRISKIMSTLAASQVTEQPQRAALRFRFQPARLLRLRNKQRFRSDWLRSFLPAKHALYLENADEYGLFLLKTQQIRRLRYGARGIASWQTAPQGITFETRARQLISMRYARVAPRFETMLQGTRRLPGVECVPTSPHVADRPYNFFIKQFSTHSRRSTAIVVKRLRQQTRFVSINGEAESVTPFIYVTARYRVVPRVEARGKTSFVGAERPSMLYTLFDLRTNRAKSPRSRQYLTRSFSVTPVTAAKQVTSVLSYRGVVARLTPAARTSQWTRRSRRFIRPAVGVLHKVSSSSIFRCKTHTYPVPSYQLSARTLKTQKSVFSVRTASVRGAQQTVLRPRLQVVKPVTIGRSILQHRTAMQRSTAHNFRVGLALPSTPILPHQPWSVYKNPRLARALGPYATGFGASKSTVFCERSTAAWMALLQSKGHMLSTLLHKEQRALENHLMLLSKKHLMSFTQAWRIKFMSLSARINRIRALVHAGIKKQQQWGEDNLRTLSLRRARLCTIEHVGHSPTVTAGATKPHFFVYGGAAMSTVDLVTELCAERTVMRQQTPFDTYRARLWNNLTLRRMKRERIIRYWIKGTSRWMRDPWIADIVNLSMRSQPGRLAGELRPVEQQIGEYVSGVDAKGKDVTYADSQLVERHAYTPRPQPKMTELKLLSRVRGAVRPFVRQRLEISRSLRRKPIPAMWLANYEYNDFWREFKENKNKSREQQKEEAEVLRKEAFSRLAAGLPPLPKRRYSLKMPPLPKLPKSIWKEIHRRARRLEWRESDEVFFRKGFRNAFRFYPQERARAPWLEALMYTRATFSTRLREFRRRQFPREQKKYKWLQRVRKALFFTRTNRYVRSRKWAQLRIYNQRLHYSLFNLPDRNAARRHFRKLNRRTRPAVSSFVSATRGLGDRLDVTLMHLKVAPSIFWARVVAPFGLVRVDGVVQTNPAYRISPGALIQLEWSRIARFQHFFSPSLNRREVYQRRAQRTTSSYPTNFEYHRGTRAIVYKHAPDEADLRKSSRVQANLFRWFKLDSL